MTERLELRDPYLRETQATVVSAASDSVVLDRTILYAEGGGQAPDHGVIRWTGHEAHVVDSQQPEKNGPVTHKLEGPVPAAGTAVVVEVDWPRRHGLMRHHTAAHVIAAILIRMGASFTGGQLYPDRARIDVEFPTWKPEMKDEIQTAVNAEITKDYPVKNYEISREDFERRGDLLRTKENLVDPSLKLVRITDIVGLDAQADGGTHVRSTKEVGRFVIDKVDNKGKGHRRLSFHLE